MRFETVIRPGFNGDSDCFRFALFTKHDCFVNRRWRVTTQSVVQVSNEVITVLFIKTHEGSAHDDKLHLVCIVTESFKLFNSVFSLEVWVVPCSDSTHWCWLVACVALSGVFEIRIWATWTVDTNISGHGNVWAPMRFGHNSNNCNTWSSPYRLTFKKWSQFIFMTFRQRCQNVHYLWHLSKFVLWCNLGLQLC